VAVLTVAVAAIIGYALSGQTPINMPTPNLSASATSMPSTAATPQAPAPAPTPATTTPGDVTALLATIPVKGRAPGTGYDASQAFWGMWQYTDGCSTRNLILARDLTQVTYLSPTSCIVDTGVLHDPYSGAIISFQHGSAPGESDAVQIDHVVSRMNAWVTGAFTWTPEQRYAFANDPLDLLAVDGAVNQAKGNADAASWLPPNKAFRCQYVTIQVEVKAKYGLWMTKSEHDAIAGILASC